MAIVFFKPSEFSLEIVGEQSYQKAIRDVAMYKDLVDRDDMEDKMTGLMATLVLDDSNKFDPGNAVRVDIEEKTVGYLAKEEAGRYRQALKKLNLTNETCTCYAAAYGKRPEHGKMMVYGIWLSIDLARLEPGDPPRKKFLGIF